MHGARVSSKKWRKRKVFPGPPILNIFNSNLESLPLSRDIFLRVNTKHFSHGSQPSTTEPRETSDAFPRMVRRVQLCLRLHIVCSIRHTRDILLSLVSLVIHIYNAPIVSVSRCHRSSPPVANRTCGTKREDERIGRRETYRREVGGGKKGEEGSGIGACMVGHAGLGLCMRGNTRTCQIYHSARCIGTVDRSLPTLFNFPCSVRINKR